MKISSINDYTIVKKIPSFLHEVYIVIKNDRPYQITLMPIKNYPELSQDKSKEIYRLLKKLKKYVGLEHQNIEQIYQIFEYEKERKKMIAIVAQYFHEGDLQDFIIDGFHKDSDDIKLVMLQVSAGLHFLHENEILYDNFCLENIKRKDNAFKLCFSSFREIAKFNRKHQKKGQIQKYSQSCIDFYEAPEKYFKEGYNESSDIWSLGLIFYELMTSKLLKLTILSHPCLEKGFPSSIFFEKIQSNMMKELIKMMITKDTQRVAINRMISIIQKTDIFSKDAQEQIHQIPPEVQKCCLPLFNSQPIVKMQSSDKKGHAQQKQFTTKQKKVMIRYTQKRELLQIIVYDDKESICLFVDFTYQTLPLSFRSIFDSINSLFYEISKLNNSHIALLKTGQLQISFQQQTCRLLKQLIKKENPYQTETIDNTTHTTTNRDIPTHKVKQSSAQLQSFKQNKERNEYSFDSIEMMKAQVQTYYGYDSVTARTLMGQITIKLIEADRFQEAKVYQQKIITSLYNYYGQYNEHVYTYLHSFNFYYFKKQKYQSCLENFSFLIKNMKKEAIHIYSQQINAWIVICSQFLNKQETDQIMQQKLKRSGNLDYFKIKLNVIYNYIQLCKVAYENPLTFQRLDKSRQSLLQFVRNLDFNTPVQFNIYLYNYNMVFVHGAVSLYEFGAEILTIIYHKVKHERNYVQKQINEKINDFVTYYSFQASRQTQKFLVIKKWIQLNMPDYYHNVFS